MIGEFVDHAKLIVGQLIGATDNIVEAFLLGGDDLPDECDLIVILEVAKLCRTLLEILVALVFAIFQR